MQAARRRGRGYPLRPVQLCMFHPVDHPMERGWVGRVDGDRVVHLAAQTLQSFFTGGGSAREHAEYPLEAVCLLAPVLHPLSVRVFERQDAFAFANPAAIVGPRAEIDPGARTARHRSPSGSEPQAPLVLLPRLAGVIGAGGTIAGFTCFGEWRYPAHQLPKDRDFALGLGPVVVTPDALDPVGLEAVARVGRDEHRRGRLPRFDWAAARDLAETGTVLRAGDVLAGPSLDPVPVSPGSDVELEIEGIGVLAASVAEA